MFEKHAKDLDVVFVATPDHSHFAPTMTAVSHGHHCYTEKPLTWSVREAQLLAAAYAKNPKVVTQMGNQGHAGQGWRMAYEFIKGGAIGDVLEFHTWTNRPIWPQGGDRPTWTDPVPATLDWDAWIGPAPMRPYAASRRGQTKRLYHPFMLARVRRLRLRRPGRHGLPHHRRHLRDHGARLRRHRRADLHDRPGQGPVPRRHDHQDDLPSQGRPPRIHHLLVRGQARRRQATTCLPRPRN